LNGCIGKCPVFHSLIQLNGCIGKCPVFHSLIHPSITSPGLGYLFAVGGRGKIKWLHGWTIGQLDNF